MARTPFELGQLRTSPAALEAFKRNRIELDKYYTYHAFHAYMDGLTWKSVPKLPDQTVVTITTDTDDRGRYTLMDVV